MMPFVAFETKNISKVTTSFIPVHVPVETVVQGYELKLQQLRGPPSVLHVEVLQACSVGLVVRQGERCDVH